MPFRLLATAMTATILATTAAHASPDDYADRLPGTINDMELVEAEMVDGSLVAYSAHLQFAGYLIGGIIDGGTAQPSK